VKSMETWISIIGSIASIGGAAWAWYQAVEAAKSASKAEKVKGEMIERRKIVEVSQVHRETTRILQVVSKVGPSCNSSTLRGVNCSHIATEVSEYSRFLNEHSSHFTEFFENKAKELCAAIKEDIERLAEAKTFDDKKNAGKSIYYKIDEFVPIVKSLSDEKREAVPTN
jgi:hypothetical protein